MIAQAAAVYAMLGAIFGGACAALAAVWNGRRTDRTEQRNTSGTVATADSAVVFANQVAAFQASEQLRKDTAAMLADQIQRCQDEIQALKQEMHERDEAAQARIERLEASLLQMSQQLRKDGA